MYRRSTVLGDEGSLSVVLSTSCAKPIEALLKRGRAQKMRQALPCLPFLGEQTSSYSGLTLSYSPPSRLRSLQSERLLSMLEG